MGRTRAAPLVGAGRVGYRGNGIKVLSRGRKGKGKGDLEGKIGGSDGKKGGKNGRKMENTPVAGNLSRLISDPSTKKETGCKK